MYQEACLPPAERGPHRVSASLRRVLVLLPSTVHTYGTLSAQVEPNIVLMSLYLIPKAETAFPLKAYTRLEQVLRLWSLACDKLARHSRGDSEQQSNMNCSVALIYPQINDCA